MNKTILIGRITKDLELKYTQSNIAYCKFTLAVNRSFKEDGEYKADFIRCVAWRNQAENLCKYQGKGSHIAVEGRIQTGSYDDQDGKRVYTTDVVCDSIEFLDSKPKQDYPKPQSKTDQVELASDPTLPF